MSDRPLKFLFPTFDGGGNVAPTMSVVERLIARGHRVRVMSDEATRSEFEAAGARLVPWVRAPNKSVRSRETDFPDWTLTPEEGLRVLAESFMGGCALAHAEDVIGELDRESADLVVAFDMLIGAMTACEARDQKLALLTTCISNLPIPGVPPIGSGLGAAKAEADRARVDSAIGEHVNRLDAGLGGLNAARARVGLKPLQHLHDQAAAAAAWFLGTARAFDFPSNEMPDHVRYVGPLLRAPLWAQPWVPPWEKADHRPLVVCGFSTSFQNHADCMQRVIDACASLRVRTLVTLGGAIRRDELRAADNTFIVSSAPHDEVMRHAAAVVTHGGHGTVMTALSHGVPMLILPHGRDQADNAVRVTERCAGLSLPNTSSRENLRSALCALLEEIKFRTGAEALGKAIRAEVRNSTLLEDLESLARQ